MRRIVALAASLLTAAVALWSCGSDSEPDAAPPTTSTESGIQVTGEVGAKPELEVPAGDPPAELVVDVLSEGDGSEVAAGDFLVANYLGQTWAAGGDGAANVFDNSYDGEPRRLPHRRRLSHHRVGRGTGRSEGRLRVLLVVPPDKAYGDTPPEGSPIEADATLIFVVDIVDSYGDDAAISGSPVPDLPADLPRSLATAALRRRLSSSRRRPRRSRPRRPTSS